MSGQSDTFEVAPPRDALERLIVLSGSPCILPKAQAPVGKLGPTVPRTDRITPQDVMAALGAVAALARRQGLEQEELGAHVIASLITGARPDLHKSLSLCWSRIADMLRRTGTRRVRVATTAMDRVYGRQAVREAIAKMSGHSLPSPAIADPGAVDTYNRIREIAEREVWWCMMLAAGEAWVQLTRDQ